MKQAGAVHILAGSDLKYFTFSEEKEEAREPILNELRIQSGFTTVFLKGMIFIDG